MVCRKQDFAWSNKRQKECTINKSSFTSMSNCDYYTLFTPRKRETPLFWFFFFLHWEVTLPLGTLMHCTGDDSGWNKTSGMTIWWIYNVPAEPDTFTKTIPGKQSANWHISILHAIWPRGTTCLHIVTNSRGAWRKQSKKQRFMRQWAKLQLAKQRCN